MKNSNLLEHSQVHLRGQVWYWQDPIYGSKEERNIVDNGEATERFNRYCIVVQDTNTITSGSILVVPCTTSINSSTFNEVVKVHLTHLMKECDTYAKVRCVFPVNPKCLARYICTLSDSDMKRIESALLKLLIPSINNAMDNETIKSTFGIDMNNFETPANIDTEDGLESIDKKDNDEHVEEVNTPEPVVKVKSNYIYSDDEIVDFMSFYHDHNGLTTAKKYNISINTVYWRKNHWKERYAKILEDRNKSDEEAVSDIPLPTRSDICLSISKVCNMMIESLKTWNTYSSTSVIGIDEDNFYNILNDVLYSSLIDYMGITFLGNNEFNIPNITPENKNIKSWHFFDKVYHDRRIRKESDGQEMIRLYRKYYGDINTGIDNEWAEEFRKQLINQTIIGNETVVFIYNSIKFAYCAK